MHGEPYPFPPLHAAWLEGLLPPGGLPRERRATCDDCAMCARPDGTLPTASSKQNVLSYSEIYGRLNGVK